jgi:hypothetical protein
MNMMQMPDNVVQLRDETESFPLTLAACKKGDFSNWEIGDALIKECGPPGTVGIHNGSFERIEAAAKYLANNGLEFQPKSLKIYSPNCS